MSAGAIDDSARAATARPASVSTRPAAPGEKGPRGGDTSARDEERTLKALLQRGHEQAELQSAKPLQLAERARDLCQRSDPVAQPRGVLEAEVARKSRQLRAQRRQRVGRLALPAVERPGGETGSSTAPERPVRAGSVGHAPAGSSPAQVHMAVGPRAAGVCRRPQLAEKPELLERSLELGAEHAPFDPLERSERGLDGRPLPLGPEVGAQPGAEVTRPSDVEHLLVAVAEEVDPRPLRRSRDERALARKPAGARRREVGKLGDRARTTLLRETDQREQDLRRRLCIGERPVTGPRRRAEEVRERCQPDTLNSVGEHSPRQPDGVDDLGGDSPARQPLDLAVEEADVEPCVVGDEHRVAGELEETTHCKLHRRCAAQLARVDPRQGRDRSRQGPARVDERLEPLLELESAHAHRADLADRRAAGRESRRLEIDDDVGRRLERQLSPLDVGKPDVRPTPAEPRIPFDDVREERPRQPRRNMAQRIERAGRVLRRYRPVPGFDELDETVGGVERKLHGLQRRRTYVRLQGHKEGRTA